MKGQGCSVRLVTELRVFSGPHHTNHVEKLGYCVTTAFQGYGSLMLTTPDYFFPVRDIGRLRQTNLPPDGHVRVVSLVQLAQFLPGEPPRAAAALPTHCNKMSAPP